MLSRLSRIRWLRALSLFLCLSLILASTGCAKKDKRPPSIDDSSVTDITQTSATIAWATSEPATSQVEFGTTAAYGSSSDLDTSLVDSHAVSLSGLAPSTIYHCIIRSSDKRDNVAVSDDFTFTTLNSTPPVQPTGQLAVHFIDVGQADAILLDCGDYEVLIDGGKSGSGVATYLSPYVDGPLEAVVATHMDADHIGGLAAVLGAFQVQQVWHNGATAATQTYTGFINAVQAEGADVHAARRGDTITVGSMVFSVLSPVDVSGTSNNNSVVLSLSWGQTDFLFEGDAEQEAEASMVTAGLVPDVEILKVGHHGSRTASSAVFLAAAKPEVAIYMAGTGNNYGHPHAETITALQAIGATIYGTDVKGDIVVTTNGQTYNVTTER
jgi:beta-lactamase superfamily II metal-dependent hydrolase